MSNTFATPKVVATIAQSRIDYNKSLQALLENFASSGEPDGLEVKYEDADGLRPGMLWYKSGTDTTDAQGRLLVYDGTEFTRNGINTYKMPDVTSANAAIAAGKISYGDLVVVGSNKLYLVNTANTGVYDVGSEATTVGGYAATQIFIKNEDNSSSGSINLTGSGYLRIPTGSAASRPVSPAIGMIRFDNNSNNSFVEVYSVRGWEPLSPIIAKSNGIHSNLRLGLSVATPNSNLTVNGNAYVSGNIYASSNVYVVGDVITASDQRLKTNVFVIPEAIDTVTKLQGVTYTRIDSKINSMGFIAQEVEEILPDLVYQQGEYKGISYSNMVALLVEAFKEYKTLTDTRIQKLEDQVSTLTERLDT